MRLQACGEHRYLCVLVLRGIYYLCLEAGSVVGDRRSLLYLEEGLLGSLSSVNFSELRPDYRLEFFEVREQPVGFGELLLDF